MNSESNAVKVLRTKAQEHYTSHDNKQEWMLRHWLKYSDEKSYCI
jgi:hypothetical protein